MRTVLALALVLISVATAAKEAFGPYRAEVVRVKDGDTVLVDVHIWPGLTQRISLRLDGVNTPETRRPAPDCEREAGRQAKAFVRGLLSPGDEVIIREVRLGKYAGRALGKIEVDGQDLGEMLIREHLARPYHGGRRSAWCQ